MRRALAPDGHRIAAIRGRNEKTLWVSVASQAYRLKGSWRFLYGARLVPRCPYKRPGRGSIPRRSISALYFNTTSGECNE